MILQPAELRYGWRRPVRESATCCERQDSNSEVAILDDPSVDQAMVEFMEAGEEANELRARD